MSGKSKRCSRHIYDIFKLTPMMKFDSEFVKLIDEVRQHRAKMKICPSAQENVNLPEVILEFCSNSFYEEDYKEITSYFISDFVPYSEAIGQMRKLAQEKLFAR